MIDLDFLEREIAVFEDHLGALTKMVEQEEEITRRAREEHWNRELRRLYDNYFSPVRVLKRYTLAMLTNVTRIATLLRQQT
jgi:hypothetical protein